MRGLVGPDCFGAVMAVAVLAACESGGRSPGMAPQPDAQREPDAGSRPETEPFLDARMPGAPTLTSLVEGDGQSATVETAVAIAPRLRVTDSDGIPVSGVEVTFEVVDGGGRVEGGVVATGSDGTAAPNAWFLGPTPGANRLVGEVPGLAPVFFDATGLPDDRGSFVIDTGNHQSARVGTAVEIAPMVRLLDTSGAPVVNRAVTFTIGAGGGTVTGSDAQTDAEGRASVGAWILGPAPGDQTLVASTDGQPALTFRAVAVSADAPVLRSEPWLTGLGRPWDIAFLPDGTMLVTERGGRVLAASSGSTEVRVLLEPPADLRVSGQSGLLGIAVHPDFATHRFVYVYMSSTRGGATDNRIRRFRLSDDGGALVEDRDILTGITWGADGAHSGGRIRFGPDGHLWITTGDTRSPTVPQDLGQLGGKVLRVTTDGAPAPGNPVIAGARPEIHFIGVRNPQGLAFRPGSGDAFICEHGPNQDDEVTRLVAGGNGGWNPNDGAGNYNGYTGALMSDPGIPGLVLPSYRVEDSQGMSGCDFLVGTQWRAWDRALLVGMLAGERAIVVPLDAAGTGTTGPASHTLASRSRLRAVVQGPDGFVYVALDTTPGVVWRVSAE